MAVSYKWWALTSSKPTSAKATYFPSEETCAENMEGQNISQMSSPRLLYGICYISDSARHKHTPQIVP